MPPYGGCDHQWSEDKLYTVSYTRPGVPLPQIYNSGQASEWGELADYAKDSHSNSMYFEGSLSQYQACADLKDSCTGTDNTAATAWTELWNDLNCSSDCPTPQTPTYSADIRWDFTT